MFCWATYFIQCHPVLNKQSDTRIKVSNISLQNEILFGLSRYFALQVSQTLLRCFFTVTNIQVWRVSETRTSSQVIFNFDVLLRCHAKKSGNTVAIGVPVGHATRRRHSRRRWLIRISHLWSICMNIRKMWDWDYVAIEPKKDLSVKTMPAFVLRWVYRCGCLEMPVVVLWIKWSRMAYLHNTATPWRRTVTMIQCSSDSTRFLKCPLTSIWVVRPEAPRSPNWINYSFENSGSTPPPYLNWTG